MDRAMADRVPTIEESIGQFDYCTGESYPQELYAPTSIVTPIEGFESIDDSALGQYRRLGFLAIENAFTARETSDALEGLFHYISAEIDETPEADRLAIFGSEGKNVSC
ncbi:hypothetical protein OAS39_04620 [Pirellulales bacterium]|nr:hypothetical protein [Pirellulales bacterium]